MRKIFDLILLLVIFGFLFWQKDKIFTNYHYLLASPCDRPITYHLGEVDKGYGLTKEQFLERVDEADQIWSSVVKKNLFAEAVNGQITINLIYSQRQSMADNLNSLEQNLKSGKQSLDTSIADYQNLEADFKSKLAAFNSEVGNWNKQGGAPEDVFNQLVKEQTDLKNEADELNNLANQLNLSVQTYNVNVGQFNQQAQNFNQAIAAKPEAGLYDGSVPKIDIYLTSSTTELIHTLAHEMGHALGLVHVADPQSIMYPFTNEVVKPDIQETKTLQTYCGQRNWDLFLKNLDNNLQEKLSQLSIKISSFNLSAN